MAWVGWVGREGRGEVDREERVRRLGAALERERRRCRPGAPAPRAVHRRRAPSYAADRPAAGQCIAPTSSVARPEDRASQPDR